MKTLGNAQKALELDNREVRLSQNQNHLKKAVEGDGGGCHVPSIQRGPTCSTSLQNPTAVEERQHIPSPEKNSTTSPSILTHLIHIWTETTHFSIHVVKPISDLRILIQTCRGILYL